MAGQIVSSRLSIRNAAALLDAGHPAATAQCALAKKIAMDYDASSWCPRTEASSVTSVVSVVNCSI